MLSCGKGHVLKPRCANAAVVPSPFRPRSPFCTSTKTALIHPEHQLEYLDISLETLDARVYTLEVERPSLADITPGEEVFRNEVRSTLRVFSWKLGMEGRARSKKATKSLESSMQAGFTAIRADIAGLEGRLAAALLEIKFNTLFVAPAIACCFSIVLLIVLAALKVVVLHSRSPH